MNDISAIIFDMDGVILDSETICDKAWITAAAEMHIPDINPAITACLGTNKADTVLILRDLYGPDFDTAFFMNRTSELFREIEAESGVLLMPYAAETLSALQKRYRLALASSTRECIVRKQLAEAGVLSFFETITAGDMVVHSKPDPEIYRRACVSLGLEPGECVAVEDSPNGIKSAYAAGLLPVMIPDKVQPPADIVPLLWKCCDSLRELYLLPELNSI